ncbi:MAG: site-2 protease family protein [Bacteroidota bacterium]
MNYRLKLFTWLEIPVFVHWSFSLIVVYVLFETYSQNNNWLEALWGLLFVLCVFLCVLLHEYGHALAAKRYGISTSDITLLPIGGLARLKRIPEEPSRELVVAAAGPFVNLLIAIVLFPIIYFFRKNGFGLSSRGISFSGDFLFLLLQMNLLLIAFNLIPAFPMDGGRMLRAIIAFFTNRVSATDIAAGIGKGIAVIFIAKGFGVLPGILPMLESPFMVLIGLFVISSATSEQQMVKLMGRTKGLTVRDMMIPEIHYLAERSSIQEAAQLSNQFPGHDLLVLDMNRQLVGMLPKSKIEAALKANQAQESVSQHMIREYTMARITDQLKDAYLFMQKRRINALPVFDEGQLVGMLYFQPLQQLIKKGNKKPDQA